MNGSSHNTSARFVVSHDFVRKALGDCIPDERMEEVVRRLVSVIPDNVSQDIVRSEDPPSDKSKFWYKPSNKKLYVFNPSSSAWEESNVDNISVCISPESNDALSKDESGCFIFSPDKLPGQSEIYNGGIVADGSGNAVKTISLQNWEDDQASVIVQPLEDLGASGRWWISDQVATGATVNFAGLTASKTYQCKITVTKAV